MQKTGRISGKLPEWQSSQKRSRIPGDALIEYDRNKLLFDQSVISKSEIQIFELRLKTTKEELDASQNQLQIIKEGASKASGSSSNTYVKATITGMVLDVPVKEGGQVIESN